MSAVTDQAAQLIAAGRREDGLSTLERAAGSGDVEALYALATHRLAGEIVPRDVPAARALLQRAIAIGHVDAALMEIAFTANGTGGAEDWARARRLLEEAAIGDPVAAQHRELIDAMTLDDDGGPADAARGETLSKQPRVILFRHFLSRSECEYVARTAAPFLERAVVADPVTGALREHPVRTSDGAIIGPAREDLVIGAINRRIARVSDTARAQGEPLTILRYAPGQQYRPHLDTLPGVANQRIRTVIIYLNEGFGGGETVFVTTGLRVRPRAGDAILFDNCQADGSPDPASAHAGLPVTAGSKWIATRWIRAEPLDLWARDQVQTR
jgi:prolyl 4-hydroxylase